MATNDFLVFGGGSSPNVIDQATYAALTARLSGFQSGTALSAQLNKVWRQSSIMAAVLAQFTANYSGQNSVDDGTTATLLANFMTAINAAGITASQFDNSTKQATTAFVQRALGNFQAFYAYTSSQTLTASQSGSVINFWGGSASTYTLPSCSAMPVGGAFLFNNSSTAPVTVTRAGSDAILCNGSSTSIVVGGGDNLLLVAIPPNQWVATGGSAQLPFAGTMQRVSGGVVGAARNAFMSVSGGSASATYTADEVVVETALGGTFFRLAGFNKSANLMTTGAGGMDAGTAPTNGYVAFYAIYNPQTDVRDLLLTNATTGRVSEVYSGAYMPSGYTASALVSVLPTNGSGQFVAGVQIDRQVAIPALTVLSSSTTQASVTSLSITSAVPPNARKVSGTIGVSSTSSTPNTSLSLYASSAGVGIQGVNTSVGAAGGNSVGYKDLLISVPQTIYYTATSSAGTPSFTATVSGYDF